MTVKYGKLMVDMMDLSLLLFVMISCSIMLDKFYSPLYGYMDNTPNKLLDWLVLDWYIRGLNDKDKRIAVYNKIDEIRAAIVCLQETKCETFDHSFIRSFYPKRFDQFIFSPSVGASGGIIILWNSSVFSRNNCRSIILLS
jgi:hypothetical protein